METTDLMNKALKPSHVEVDDLMVIMDRQILLINVGNAKKVEKKNHSHEAVSSLGMCNKKL